MIEDLMLRGIVSTHGPSRIVLLSGDEAVARGAIEAGVRVAASYPGTPATEILEAIASVSRELGVHAEWSTNEKVATEVAAGAAMAGVRSLVSMKHVGLNVASDAVMTLAYTGVVGGMVIVVCDDPGMHSSQNEQDTRYFAVHSKLPLLDAGTPQEAKDMTVEAFELSEKLALPVILRLTTRVCHGKARVELGTIRRLDRKAAFDRNASRWTMMPVYAKKQLMTLNKKLAESKELAEGSRFNIVEDNGREVGIIGSGIGYYHARSVLGRDRFTWLKLGFVHPFPKDLVRGFSSKVNEVVVVEELRPFIEENVKCLDLGKRVFGKSESLLEEIGEFAPETIRNAFANLGLCERSMEGQEPKLPPRSPVLCPGCPHRAFYHSLKEVKRDAIVMGDIGCYTLGALPPLEAIQSCLCMGSGISQAAGIRQAGVEETIFAVIGDSTFFHAGMPGLLNLVYNDARVCVVVLDNQTVAMTGHQPTQETGYRITGEEAKKTRIEDVARALGIDRVEVIDPYDLEETQSAIQRVIGYDGPSVIVSRRPCVLGEERGQVRTVAETCRSCGVCVKVLGCPAITVTNKCATIDPNLCKGCGICEKVCPSRSIEVRDP